MPINIFQAGRQGWDDAQAMYETGQRKRAGSALAGGDRQGAMQALGSAGLVDDVRQVQQDQRTDENTQYERAHATEQQDYTRSQAEQEKRAKFLKDVAGGLKGVPAGERRKALDQVLPHFAQLGIKPDDFAGLSEDQLTDQNLDIFSGEIEKAQIVNLGGGGVGKFTPRSGAFETLREPTLRPVIVGNGATALDPETGEPVYVNPKQFAPPRPRAAPKGGGSDNSGALQALEAELRRRGKL